MISRRKIVKLHVVSYGETNLGFFLWLCGGKFFLEACEELFSYCCSVVARTQACLGCQDNFQDKTTLGDFWVKHSLFTLQQVSSLE